MPGSCRTWPAAAALAVLLAATPATAGLLTVLPVTLQLAPGQSVATLTLINDDVVDTAIQVRVFAWTQDDKTEQLVPTDDVMISPPLATIAPRTAQIVRLALRRPPQGAEASFRILVDQIPPPAAPGTVRMALRLSIPVFAEPGTRIAARLKYHVETKGDESWLVAVNTGTRHEKLREIRLIAADGRSIVPAANQSPYVLPGAERRWPLNAPAGVGPLRLGAKGDTGAIDAAVDVGKP